MTLNTSARVVLVLSLITAGIGILGSFAVVSFIPASAFWVVAVGFSVLAAGYLLAGA